MPDMDGETLTYEPSTPGSFAATTPSAESMDLNSPTMRSRSLFLYVYNVREVSVPPYRIPRGWPLALDWRLLSQLSDPSFRPFNLARFCSSTRQPADASFSPISCPGYCSQPVHRSRSVLENLRTRRRLMTSRRDFDITT